MSRFIMAIGALCLIGVGACADTTQATGPLTLAPSAQAAHDMDPGAGSCRSGYTLSNGRCVQINP